MPLTDELSFQLSDTGVVLNTDSTGLPFVDITGVIGLDNAPYRETERDHEGTDGGFMDAEFEKGRPVILQGQVYADTATMETYFDTLKANWAPSTSLIPLYFKSPGVDERLLFVKPLGCRYDWESMRRYGCADIQFKAYAEDPRIYTAEEQVVVINYGGEAGTGFAFSLGFDFSFGPAIPPTGANIPVGGSRPTPATLTIVGPITSPVITNDTLGVSLAFNLTMTASDTLVIDLANRTVLLNGQNRRNTLLVPNWFFLSPGSTFLRFGGGNGTGSSLTVRYRDAWR
jgi:hypothetical protein